MRNLLQKLEESGRDIIRRHKELAPEYSCARMSLLTLIDITEGLMEAQVEDEAEELPQNIQLGLQFYQDNYCAIIKRAKEIITKLQ